MSFIKDLPSIPSPVYSRENIELFDKWREKYAESVRIYRELLSSFVDITIDMDLYEKAIKEYPHLDVSNIIQKKDGMDKYIKSPLRYQFELFNDINREIDKPYCRSILCLQNGVLSFRNYDFISAFYIPEDMEWINIEIYNTDDDLINELAPEIDLTYHPLYNNHIEELETILDRSKDFSFIDNFKNNLEEELKINGKINISPDGCGEETIEVEGIKYKRIVLFHPVLPLTKMVQSEIRCRTSDRKDVFIEVISHKTKFNSPRYSGTITDDIPNIKHGFYSSDNGGGCIYYSDDGYILSVDDLDWMDGFMWD